MEVETRKAPHISSSIQTIPVTAVYFVCKNVYGNEVYTTL